MKHTKNSSVVRFWVGAVITAASAAVAGAAGPAAAGGGGHAGGGGGGGEGAAHAAPSSGGESHAAAPAEHAAPAAVNTTPAHATAESGHTERPAFRSGATGNTPVAVNGSAQNTAGSAISREHGEGRVHRNEAHRPYNPYVPQQYRNYQNYGVVYGDPFAPFSYGWGGGWYGGYGTQYGYSNYTYNSNYPSDLPYGEYNNDESLAANPPATAQQTTTDQPAQSGGSTNAQPVTSAAMQARITNAVDKSPALIQANGAVAQAQAAYDAERAKVITALADKPEYKEAMARRKQATKDVGHATTQSSGRPTEQLSEAANERLEAGDEVTKMRGAAVAADPAAAAAKGRLLQAVTDRDALKAQLTQQAESQAR